MHQLQNSTVRQGHSRLPSAKDAVKELWEQIYQPDMSIVLLFCAASYDLDSVAGCLDELNDGALIVGCTTAGELSQGGYQQDSICAASFARPDFYGASEIIENARDFSVGSYHKLVQSMVASIEQEVPDLDHQQLFALLLVDGLCAQEEAIVSSVYNSLGEIPVFGASAGDSLNFEKTHVLYKGRFRDDAAVITLIATKCPFRVFKTEHFVGSDTKMVVTRADPVQRIVTEINGDPAGREYARLVGLPETELSPMVFASHPVVVRVGGELYVRSIQKVNEDESLTFFCAIDEGIVLTVAKGVGLITNLEEKFKELREDIGDIQMTIGCDCILRRLELEQKHELNTAEKILGENRVLGFNTYGEQFQSMHVNQTFTGVAIGYRGDHEL